MLWTRDVTFSSPLPWQHKGVKTSLTWDTISRQYTKCKPWQTSICCCVKKWACVLMLTSTKPFVLHITVLTCWDVCYLQGLLGDNHFCLFMVERMMWRAQRPREVTCTATTDCCYLMTVRVSAALFLQLSLSSWTWRHWNLCDTLCGCSGTELCPSMSWLITVGRTNTLMMVFTKSPGYYILNLFLSRSWDHDGSRHTDRGWLWVPLGSQLPEPLPADQLVAWSAEEVGKTRLLLSNRQHVLCYTLRRSRRHGGLKQEVRRSISGCETLWVWKNTNI